MHYTFNFLGLLPYWGLFLSGVARTLELTIFATAFGLAIGTLCAIGKRSHVAALRNACGVYVEIIRNTPFIVQIFLLYFGLSSIGLRLPAMVAAVIAMVINVGAYSAEIIRAGMDAIPHGQIEAAECLGLSRPRVYWHVILQPAAEKIYPALTSQFILMMLMSSIASQISVEELTAVANQIQSETFLSVETYIVVAAFYLILAVLLKLGFWLAGDWVFKRKRTIRNALRRQRQQAKPLTYQRGV